MSVKVALTKIEVLQNAMRGLCREMRKSGGNKSIFRVAEEVLVDLETIKAELKDLPEAKHPLGIKE